MKISGDSTPIPAVGQSEDNSVVRQLRSHLRSLGDTAGVEFTVRRDPSTQRFVVQILDPETRAVLDQIPAENILKEIGSGAND
jgi:uncharacterized FlaG/YvyC family protein